MTVDAYLADTHGHGEDEWTHLSLLTALIDTERTPMPTTDPTVRDHRRLGPLLSIAEVADALGVQVRHVRRLVQERRIPFIKWGHLLRFDPADIQDWIEANRRDAVQR